MVEVATISSRLQQGPDGIWYAPQSGSVSYPVEGYARCLSIEEGSFWFRHRNECIVAAVQSYGPPGAGEIFDVGGGNGFVSLALIRAGFETVLVEPGREGARNAKRRGVETVVCATLDGAGFVPGTLSSCGLFDVLEHTVDDRAFLRSIGELLVPKGRLYVTVPAYPALWSEEDELAGHHRRYTLASLTSVLKTTGFEISFATYLFRFLPVATFLTRALPYRLGLGSSEIDMAAARREHLVSHRLVARGLSKLLAPEVNRIERAQSMPFGASCLVVGTRP
jgi:SAM-dependent methyltransferase